MVYFLGRDCAVYIVVENNDAGDNTSKVYVTAGNPSTPTDSSAGANVLFAGLLSQGVTTTAVSDVTGVDLSIGAMDEDITYFGFRSVTKAEIKKETTVSITRKKSDTTWDVIFDGARYGLSGSNFTSNALTYPKQETGYRIFVVLKGTGDNPETFSVCNSCVQSHSVSINADGTTEETLEFMSYVDPSIGTAAYTTVTAATEL